MYVLQEMRPEFHVVDAEAKELITKILSKLKPSATGVKLSSNIDVYGDPARKDKLYLLTEGVLAYTVHGKVIFYFDVGSLVGVEHFLSNTQAKVVSDFAVVVDEYDASELMKVVTSSPDMVLLWSRYLAMETNLLAYFTSTYVHTTEDARPDIRTYRKGEKLIEQGTQASEVYTLVEGEAEAFVDNVKVGEIHLGEIFGVIAALTGIPRTATVIAKKNSVALVLPKENFVHLIESHPAMVLKMVEDMSKTLVALNEKVVGLSLSKF